MKKHFLALIPAKKKSERLKDKNLLKIKNKTLLEISINSSLKSKYIDKTYVSTNSKKIYQIAKKNNSYALLRKKKYSYNNAPTFKVVLDFIEQLGIKSKKNLFIVYLQPTSPLRTSYQIDIAIEKFIKSKKSSLISFKLYDNKILKGYFLKDKNFTPLYNNAVSTNSEKLPKVFMPNGAIFIFSVKDFIKNRNFPTKNIYPFIMSDTTSIDIDNYKDYLIAKKLFK